MSGEAVLVGGPPGVAEAEPAVIPKAAIIAPAAIAALMIRTRRVERAVVLNIDLSQGSVLAYKTSPAPGTEEDVTRNPRVNKWIKSEWDVL
jgi:hypothetical protein